MDCRSCINKGFKYLKLLNECIEYDVISIGTNSTFHKEQINHQYYNYIYEDGNELIRKELKFVPTPIFILIDDNEQIVNLCVLDSKFKHNIDQFRSEVMDYLYKVQ